MTDQIIPRNNPPDMTAIAILHRDEIIAGLASGKRISDLGLPCSRQAVSAVLKHDPEYREAIEAGFHVRLDTAEKAIEIAEDGLDVARARARFDAVRWRASTEGRAVWGANIELTGAGGAPLIPAQPADMARAVAFLLAKGGQDISDAEVIEPERIAQETGSESG